MASAVNQSNGILKSNKFIILFISTIPSTVCSGVVGYYKVRAVDFFGRKGPFSTPVHYGTNATFHFGSSKEKHIN